MKTEKQTWTTEELQKEFNVIGFMAPYVHVIRKKDNVEGSMEFSGSPRVYHDFQKA